MWIHWTKKAIHNLEAIEHYIAQENPIAAENILNKIITSVELILQNPGIGRPGRVIGTRELIIAGTPCLVPYRIREQQIEILRVFHSAMFWPEKF